MGKHKTWLEREIENGRITRRGFLQYCSAVAGLFALPEAFGGRIARKKPSSGFGEPYYYVSRLKQDHPEYLIGNPADNTPTGTFRYWERSALNYALGQIRQYMYGTLVFRDR